MSRARWSALAAALVLVACSSTDNHSGSVSVKLNGPTALRAISLQVIGTQTSVSVPSGMPARVFTTKGLGDTLDVMVVANQGTTLGTPAFSIQLPDTRVAPTLRLRQVAAADYSLPDISLYSIVVLGPD